MPQYLSNPKRTGSLENTGSAKLLPGGPVEIGVVFDRSSSMKHLQNAALAGFNILLEEQKKLVVPTRFSLSFFSDDVAVVHNGAPIAGISPMEPADYQPEGNTALLDGIGTMIEMVATRTDSCSYPARVLIAILSDGMENSSVRFSKEEIFKLISFRRLACDWQFLFMGVGGQTTQTGLSFGIQRANIVKFGADPEGIRQVMLALAGALKAFQLGHRNFARLTQAEDYAKPVVRCLNGIDLRPGLEILP
jgi:hypothetical protein